MGTADVDAVEAADIVTVRVAVAVRVAVPVRDGTGADWVTFAVGVPVTDGGATVPETLAETDPDAVFEGLLEIEGAAAPPVPDDVALEDGVAVPVAPEGASV